MKRRDVKRDGLAWLVSVLYLTDSSDRAKVNLGLVVYALQKYTVYLTSPACWVMTGNDYSNAQCLGYCTRSPSKQTHRCLFEFSILYCHVSLGCLEFTPSDGSFPSLLFTYFKTYTRPKGAEYVFVSGGSGIQGVRQMFCFITPNEY